MKTDSSSIDDRTLLSGCLDGDRRMAELFVLRYSNLVYRNIRHILVLKQIRHEQEDLADLHNTVFLQLFERQCKKLRQFQGKNGCSLATWVRTVTVRIVLNQVRKKGVDGLAERDRAVPMDAVAELREQNSANPLKIMETAQQRQWVRECMGRLPPRERLLLKLHFEKDLALPEVAEFMGITAQNAYTIKHRAVRKLKSLVIERKT